MLSHRVFYDIYKEGVKARRKWEATHLSSIEKYLEVLEQARKRKVSELQSAVNGLAGYEGYYLTPIVELNEKDSEDLFNALNKKYDFVLTDITTGPTFIKFVSRAIISESDPSTNTLFKVDLGLFETSVSFRDYLSHHPKPIGISEIKSRPLKENKPKQIDGLNCYHPHINNNHSLCLGSYGSGAYHDDVKKYNILGIIYNLCELLCRYNPNSLNFSGGYISNWHGHKCKICFEYAPTAVQCEKTKAFIHKECAEEIDGKFYGLDQVKKCTKCETRSPFYIAYSRDNIVCSSCEKKESESL